MITPDMLWDIKRLVETYAEQAVQKIEAVRDPEFSDTIAVQATMVDGDVFTFLVSQHAIAVGNIDDIDEVEFECWPPRSIAARL